GNRSGASGRAAASRHMPAASGRPAPARRVADACARAWPRRLRLALWRRALPEKKGGARGFRRWWRAQTGAGPSRSARCGCGRHAASVRHRRRIRLNAAPKNGERLRPHCHRGTADRVQARAESGQTPVAMLSIPWWRARRCGPAPARARGWQQSHAPANACQKQTSAAIARTPDRAEAARAPTTSSCLSRDLLGFGCAQERTRARRQAQDADESGRVLLVVALAHGERRQIGAIQRVLRAAASDRDIPFVEAEPNRAADFALRAGDECIERFTQRCEPEPEIDQFRILECDMLLEV